MGLGRLVETVHFSVQYEQTSLGALAIAQAIAAVCESNFDSINALLPIPADEKTPGGLPPFSGLVPIIVEVLATPAAALGQNFGYEKNGRSRIQVSQALTPAAGQQVFVAELAELFMGFHRWNRGDSQGEALSVVCRDELYRSPFDVRVDAWLNSGRPNFVVAPGPDDATAITYGCGILFINYLRYQLGHPMSAICQAPGTTLTDRYRALTGAADDGFAGFSGLLKKHLPPGGTLYSLSTDNPFPLYEDASRRSIIPSNQKHTSTKAPPVVFLPHGKAHVKPFFTCPAKDYTYEFAAHRDSARVEVQVIGFAQPLFQWRVGSETLPAAMGGASPSGSSSLTADVDAPDPAKPGEPAHLRALLNFDYAVNNRFTTDSMSSVLEVSNLSYAGTYSFDVELTVTEARTDVGAISLPLRVKLKALEVVYEPAFYADQMRCASAFDRAAISPNVRRVLQLVKSLPDPPPPDSRHVIVEAVLALQAELLALPERDHHATKSLVHYVSSILQVHPSTFEASLDLLERRRSYHAERAS